MIKAKQFYSKNQFVIEDDKRTIFQSYSTTIAIESIIGDRQVLTLGKYWDYSKTTSRYLYKFIEEYMNWSYISDDIKEATNKKEFIKRLIADGVIIYNEELK